MAGEQHKTRIEAGDQRDRTAQAYDPVMGRPQIPPAVAHPPSAAIVSTPRTPHPWPIAQAIKSHAETRYAPAASAISRLRGDRHERFQNWS